MLVKTFLLGLFTTILLIFFNKIAIQFNLLDLPNNRKIHTQPTPYVGGIVIGMVYLILSYFLIDIDIEVKIILICSFIISIAGLIDDKYNISPFKKILLQSLPIFYLIYNGIYLTDLGSYEKLGVLSLGNYGQIFTLLSCLLIVNAFNYCDGIDGLLSTLFINIIFLFLIICIFNSKKEMLFFLGCLINPIIIFLFFNFSLFQLPKIFLGDSGSNLLGFLTGSLMIYLYNKYEIAPSILIWPVAFIVYEFLSTNFLRLIKKKNLLKPGNDHFHYQISKKFNLSSMKVNLVINFLNILFFFIGLLIYFSMGSTFSLMTFILLFIIYLLSRIKLFN